MEVNKSNLLNIMVALKLALEKWKYKAEDGLSGADFEDGKIVWQYNVYRTDTYPKDWMSIQLINNGDIIRISFLPSMKRSKTKYHKETPEYFVDIMRDVAQTIIYGLPGFTQEVDMILYRTPKKIHKAYRILVEAQQED